MDDEIARLEAALPENVRHVCERLADDGFEAVAVGGAVRDALLGRTPGDWDVATSATPEQVMKAFDHTIATGIQHGTVTVVTSRRHHVEVTTFRGEGAYTDARRPDSVRFGVPLVEDLARRDLRVNAMAYDPADKKLVDPFGGRADLRDKMLRAVGPTGNVYDDAVARFSEDGLRVMRAVRFAAQLEFDLDPETERGIGPALPSLAKVSRERVSDELRKILGARQPSRALAIAERVGIIAQILPEVASSLVTWGIIEGGRKGAVGAWLASIDAAPPQARLAAMITEPSELALRSAIRPTSPAVTALPLREPTPSARMAHILPAYADAPRIAAALASKRLDRTEVARAETALRRLKFSNDEVGLASPLAGTGGATFVDAWTDVEVRHLLSDITRARAQVAVMLWRAKGAMVLADAAAAILARRDPLSTGDLAIAGKDLMTDLDMPQGPAIGRILAVLVERVLEDPAVNTRERLVAIARELELELGR